MHKPDKVYTLKKTAYFDHNILNHMLRYPVAPVFKDIACTHQVVYSDETLREIKRSVGGEHKLLDILISLEAMHVRIYLDENFDHTGEAILSEADPYAAYARVCSEDSFVEKFNAATQASLRKFYGDKQLLECHDLDDRHGAAFQEILNDLVESVSRSESADSQLIGRVEAYATRLLSDLITAQRQSSAMMAIYRSDNVTPIVKSYRDSVGIGPIELNNISPPNVIEKLWKLHEPLNGYKGMGFSVEDFLGISYIPKGINGRVTDFHKVIAIYNVLNVIGYHADSGLSKRRRFTSSMSDANHVAYASFADFIYSSDNGLLAKAAAIYEFLNLKTRVCRVNIIDNRKA
ncbi:hypothetical protein FA379_09455 [Pseudomonas aeruginosa]|uniref:hypothetical protein n=1 Tax=Pseudomonas aeruginosa TaxID=287 RepID=UPI00112510F3|nr:hypothetical protein [Pseudomonas aeruginosa]EKT4467649.1 hypothetical protein [Pseudomonas putida]MCO2230275.1 hypothetical protein [Pseudomonas aeruginosa]MCO2236531.1 hypothetical protein [Pseudomonas aeruginosa]MCO2238610.1 hypothetical protein [Pseudomonas aeruginosa]MCO2332863.1 hypothetical protein [Pseudomonas aeruginosa]